MFQHGNLREVVDQEKEPCGCPPAEPSGNEFPLAQSMGLAPQPKVSPAPSIDNQVQTQVQNVPPLVYQSKEHAPATALPAQPTPDPALTTTAAPAAKPQAKKHGFFGSVGHFFRRVFGAEE
jgi:hypothetical protein